MENLRLREAAPTAVNVTVGTRCREYLTDREVERLIEAAKQNRSGHRDATAILVAYRHGLRASELVALRWDDIDLATGRLHVRRAKSGDASVHPISARESRALRKLLREAPTSPYVFISERHAPLSVAGYQRMVARAGIAAKFTFLVHSHMHTALAAKRLRPRSATVKLQRRAPARAEGRGYTVPKTSVHAFSAQWRIGLLPDAAPRSPNERGAGIYNDGGVTGIHPTGSTLTEMSIHCSPDPTITPSIGATSV